MYKYDQYDQAIVDARVDEFRDQVERRLGPVIRTETGIAGGRSGGCFRTGCAHVPHLTIRRGV